jgi:rhomboid family GlyGly-CTERM serine protease
MDVKKLYAKIFKLLPLRSNDWSGATIRNRRMPWHTIALACGFVFLHYLLGPLNNVLIYDRTAIAQSQVWRLWTGHMVHYNFDHLFWNVLAFIIIGITIECKSVKTFYQTLVLSFSGVGLWLWMGEQSLMEYSGLSGALNGLFIVALWLEWRESQQKYLVLLFLGAVGKIVFELLTHQTVFMASSSQCFSVPISHLAGLISGCIAVLMMTGIRLRRMISLSSEVERRRT